MIKLFFSIVFLYIPLLCMSEELTQLSISLNSLKSFNDTKKAVAWVFIEEQGKRPTMEDEHYGKINNDFAFFGVYDGHGGKKVAEYAKDHLYNNIINSKEFLENNIEEAIKKGFIKTHNEMDEKISNKTGSTAVIAIIKNNKIYVGNAGDSRAVMTVKEKSVLELSQDHKPTRKDEQDRIKKAGGFISWYGVARVGGILAISRALGDKFLSDAGVIPDPEITVTEINPDHQFLILACDGLWDVFSSEEVGEFIKKDLSKNKADLELTVNSLKNAALLRGSGDNITIMIVDIQTVLKEFKVK